MDAASTSTGGPRSAWHADDVAVQRASHASFLRRSTSSDTAAVHGLRRSASSASNDDIGIAKAFRRQAAMGPPQPDGDDIAKLEEMFLTRQRARHGRFDAVPLSRSSSEDVDDKSSLQMNLDSIRARNMVWQRYQTIEAELSTAKAAVKKCRENLAKWESRARSLEAEAAAYLNDYRMMGGRTDSSR